MGKESNKFTDREKNVLALLDTNLSATHDVITTLERKAQYNFTLISAVAATVALININVFDIPTSKPEPGVLCVLAVFVLLYLGVAALSILTLWPKVIDLCPLQPTRTNIEGILNVDCVDFNTYCNEIMTHYADIYESHMEVTKKKARFVVCSYRLVFGAILAVLLELAIYVL